MATVELQKGHVQPVWAGHPWVFAQAIGSVKGAPGAGDVVSVVDPRGQFLGKGYWSPKSAIPVRVLSRHEGDSLDGAWIGRRIEQAVAWRRALLGLPDEETTGYRAVHAEGDGLAGLIVDVYGRVAAVQFLTVGMKLREEEVFGHVARATGAETVFEVASGPVQQREGIRAETRTVRGPDIEELAFRERGFDIRIPREVAQKTGFYFDQRDNRALVERFARGRRVLDAFTYVGAFALAAARGGAESVMAIDSSAPAITTGAAIAHHHGLGDRISLVRADVKKALPDLAREGKRFDLVIVDPPKLAPTARHLEQGTRAYRRLNGNAIRLVEPGGLLVSCSCSAALRPAQLLRLIGLSARENGRDVTLLSLGQQGPDHPVPAAFPEGRYLKCAVVKVD